MKKTILFTIFIFAVFILNAQDKENLGKHINSTFREINPIVSPDGKDLYFVRVNHPENRFGEEDSEDIWYSTKQGDESWGLTKRMSNSINIIKYNSILSVTPDG
ncbi:PD40 domain-containing protein, partial [Candidatus Venteria ishoeyi]|uniref:PD40 domain-containing protein n=1 Tax=Candidatus Venteria ishoeyi TaxID=1899563 RepID=UPI0015B28D80